VLASRTDSIIAKNSKGKATPASNNSGLSWPNNSSGANVSEIYLDHPGLTTTEVVARAAFHELMHNKLRMGDDLHARGGDGLADPDNIFSGPFGLTEENVEKMAQVLHVPAPQFILPTQPAER
jgi:hypothetical protein